jgi:very-short-patch-repair endonuclease
MTRQVTERARQMTDAEKRLWSLLRGRRLAGYKFRRQCPLAGAIPANPDGYVQHVLHTLET